MLKPGIATSEIRTSKLAIKSIVSNLEGYHHPIFEKTSFK